MGAVFSAQMAASPDGATTFHQQVEPLLKEFCYDCHGDGAEKGNVAFDQFQSDAAVLENHDLWLKVLKNLRAGLMPPSRKPQPAPEQKQAIVAWIKTAVFQIDPQNLDPGRVTVRRLNRVEYRNTIRDLMGVDFDTEKEFPPDDAGFGFDDIGDLLTLPPMLLEKYFAAAASIVAKAVQPKNYARFFPRMTPDTVEDRRAYAREILERFARRAYRRPVDPETIERLVALAESTYSQPGATFEAGISQAMTAVLASPRFLFREEGIETLVGGPRSWFIDEYALASRLSYFLWSSMPDDELFRLANQHQLRKHLGEEVKRMLADAKSEAFVRNFVGQWLQVRDINSIDIDARQVLAREANSDPGLAQRRQRFRKLRDKDEATLTADEKKELEGLRSSLFRQFNRSPRAQLDGKLRRAMQLESEKTFAYVLHEDRSLLELLDSDYTFLNERLAAHYGLTNLDVKGEAMRLVKLPPDDPRGGVLTEGSVLVVTSNPTCTSPVKRGKFILENLLGSPPAPPPPDIPPLEAAAKATPGRTPTLREMLALHREQTLCSSCHNRMDPLGLALENFNALGMWRDQEHSQPIDATGQLLSGERFNDIRELKKILVKNHPVESYRTLTEKLLIYALGRGLEYYDVGTLDEIVGDLEASQGRPSVLLNGIIESAPFQKTRARPPAASPAGIAEPVAGEATTRTPL